MVVVIGVIRVIKGMVMVRVMGIIIGIDFRLEVQEDCT